MMVQLLRVERLKLRRSLGLLVTVACPLMVAVLIFAVILRQTPSSAFVEETWLSLWRGTTAIWSYFMLPLYVALITCLVNGAEHRSHTWRVMLTLPISWRQLFFAKAFTSWILVVATNLLLLLILTAATGLLGALGYPLAGAFNQDWVLAFLKIPVACIPIVVIQHALSWRFDSVVPPLAVGVIATMGITQVGSSEYWLYYPWSYVLTAANSTLAQNQDLAVSLGLIVGGALYALSGLWLSRREPSY